MAYIFSPARAEPLKYRPGDRFSYVRKCGGWGHGTVLKVDGNTVIGHLDCQKEGETYEFSALSPHFCKGEM